MPRLSLRARLLLGVLVLAAAGLVAADVATYTSLRSSLIDRVDATLDADHRGAESSRFGPGGPAPSDYVQIRDAGGRVVYQSEVPHFPGTEAPSPPELPATITGLKQQGPDLVRYFTVPAEHGGEQYRVRASLDNGSPNMLIIATSLANVDATLHRLFLLELLVGLGVLAAIVLIGLWTVRLGLRPLQAIGRTADAIAAGDLSHRVEDAESRTEVGRLGLAFNAMLDRIEASDQRLRRFVADASHELRTPLAAIRAYAELFGRGASQRPADLERAMTGIGRESERMSALVEDLLLLARLDEGRPLERAPVRLDDVAREAVDAARAVDATHPIELTAEPLVAAGDHDRLRQVVDNLLANARAHTPAGTHVRVTVTRNGRDALIRVADDGPGMSTEQAAHVFERFYRADASRSRGSGGVGLGLSIVAAVAEAHGGAVAVETAPGRGSAFTVRLPLPLPA
ncbi:MAG TPA: HAMP domain-containing sensor histidine kinase [Gaiellaceae bacterium]|nr:HAMP domain-containing sensor histidine kinase [Gaiellaceae bacterium]